MKNVIDKLNEIFQAEGTSIQLSSEEFDFYYMKGFPKSDIYRWSVSKKSEDAKIKRLDALRLQGINLPQKVNKNNDEINGNGQTHIILEMAAEKMFWPFLNEEIRKIYTLNFPFKIFEENIDLLLNYIPENYYSLERIQQLKALYSGNNVKEISLSLKLNDGRRIFASNSFIAPESVKDFYLENKYMVFVDDYFAILKKKQKMEYVLLFLSKEMLSKYGFDFELYNGKLVSRTKINDLFENGDTAKSTDISVVDVSKNLSITGAQNLLVFGAPGTGKSHWVKKNYEEATESIRVTFHEEYSYSDFVGSLKPVSKVGVIDYEFKPGPFTKILALALGNPSIEYTLIIEELNRANAAAVFGDLFQVLDRDEHGYSKYSIENEDLTTYLKTQLNSTYGLIYLPANLNIIATMNSADQGVYALDTAFKRRWNFKYIPIEFDRWHEEITVDYFSTSDEVYEISVKDFIETINSYLSGVESLELNEDRLIGPYFIAEDQWANWLDEDVSQKVLNYLWDDVARISRSEVFLERYKQFSRVCIDFKKLESVFIEPLHTALLKKSTLKGI